MPNLIKHMLIPFYTSKDIVNKVNKQATHEEKVFTNW